MDWHYDDGGRALAGFKGTTSDCVCRAIAIGTGMGYKEVYDLINEFAKKERITKRNPKKSSARTGVSMKTAHKVMAHLGWTWHPTMQIGSGCQVHLRDGELPYGTVIVRVSRHFTCVIDGVVYDTFDCTRDGDRCVYGYYIKEEG